MKLLNPTDDKLDRTFATEIAGLKLPFELDEEWEEDGDTYGFREVLRDADGRRVPRFTHSADAVLPWLDRMNYIASACPVSGVVHHHCVITIHTWHTAEKLAEAYADTFPRAAVIALLRAHGHEVEFTVDSG